MIATELVVQVITALSSRSLTTIVDGGWGIDALVRRTTRAHADLDLAVDRRQLSDVLATIAELDFSHDTQATPGLPARIVLKDRDRHEIDLHPFVFDPDENGWQELGEGAWGAYPADGNNATGRIATREVRCLTPELQLRHHLGYPWDDADVHDMRLLQEEFRLRLPPPLDEQTEAVPIRPVEPR